MLTLVSLNSKHCAVDELPVIDPPPHVAVAASPHNRFIVRETFEVLIDEIAHEFLLRLCPYLRRARVVRE